VGADSSTDSLLAGDAFDTAVTFARSLQLPAPIARRVFNLAFAALTKLFSHRHKSFTERSAIIFPAKDDNISLDKHGTHSFSLRKFCASLRFFLAALPISAAGSFLVSKSVMIQYF